MNERKTKLRNLLDSFLINLLICLLAFNSLIVAGTGNPDRVIEGYYFYTNADWHSSGCGRWMTRYLENSFANLVNPFLIVVFHCVCIFLASLVLMKLWNCRSRIIQVLTAAVMSITPAVIAQTGFLHVMAVYSLSDLLCIIFVYGLFQKEHENAWSVLSAVLLAMVLGLYQSYIGMAALLVVLTLILQLVKGEDARNVWRSFLKAAVLALLGCVLYMGLEKVDLLIHHLSSNARMAQFSFSLIFSSLPSRIIYCIKAWINQFRDGMMGRKYLYVLLALILAIAAIKELIVLWKQGKKGNAISIVVLFLLIPLASNLIGIIIPYNDITRIMSYQTVLLAPFALVFLQDIPFHSGKAARTGRLLQQVIIMILTWTYVLSANATYQACSLSRNFIDKEMAMALERVYELPDYQRNSTRIVIGGFPQDDVIRQNNGVYRYAIDLPDNVVFWEDDNGSLYSRKNYLLDEFGVNAGDLTSEEYWNLVDTEEYQDMPVWPAVGSVSMIGKDAVIKFQNVK